MSSVSAATADADAQNATNAACTTVAEIDWSSWEPVDFATLLFVFRGDEVLLIEKKRGLGEGLVNAPGGRLEPGETAMQAAVREVQEELHVTPLEPRWCGRHRFQFRDGYSMDVQVFAADSFEGTPTETDEAVPLWVPCDAIPYERMWADDVHWIPLLLAGEQFEGRYVFDGQKMCDFVIEVVGR
ncbi:MAG: 8-oxo-dGTP diphosphatase [Myxococcales bacterium]|nr:8-oxo-dGTP diphosphatase [Myxococcales bacterium]